MRLLTILFVLSVVIVPSANCSESFVIEYPAIPTSESELDKYIEDFRDETLPRLKQIATCAKTSKYLVLEYQDFKNIFLRINAMQSNPLVVTGIPSAHYNMGIMPNFEYVLKIHERVLDELLDFVTGQLGDDFYPSATPAIYEKMEGMENSLSMISNKIAMELVPETIFMRLLEEAQSYAKNIHKIFSLDIDLTRSKSCEASGSQKIANFIEYDIAATIRIYDGIRKYIGSVRRARSNFLLYIKSMSHRRLAQAYDLQAIAELKQLLGETDNILLMSRIYNQFIEWEAKNLNQKSKAILLQSKYLQYRTPLRMLTSFLPRINLFKKQISALDGPAESKKIYIGYINRAESSVLRRINFMQDRGWKGTFDQQLRMANWYSTNLENPSESCKSHLNSFISSEEDVVDLETFESLAVGSFAKIVDHCTGIGGVN